jgi:molecular chaperone HtpG
MLKMATMVVFLFILNVRDLLEATIAITETKVARQLYDLALLAQGMLKGKALTDFIQRSVAEV